MNDYLARFLEAGRTAHRQHGGYPVRDHNAPGSFWNGPTITREPDELVSAAKWAARQLISIGAKFPEHWDGTRQARVYVADEVEDAFADAPAALNAFNEAVSHVRDAGEWPESNEQCTAVIAREIARQHVANTVTADK